jgi:3' terminal RNA ribose 2'-O-methyltransferase Hen1
MLLTISTTHSPATDLGYLLHKRPDHTHSIEVASGTAHVFYSEVSTERCTATLLLEVDPVGLIRSRGGPAQEAFTLGQYVNDRPYAASSLLAVALRRAFATALSGRSRERPELAQMDIPLEIRVPVLPCRGGAQLAQALFGPLGWKVHAAPITLDDHFPTWGESPYVDLRLEGRARLQDALSHLYVLLPVLDDAKHYWVAEDEIDKLVRVGGGWLGNHPQRELIASRYLAHQRSLVGSAIARLAEVDDLVAEDDGADPEPLPQGPEQPAPLAQQRRQAVVEILRQRRPSRVLDLGCGEGSLLQDLLSESTITELVGVDVSTRMLEVASRRLRLNQMSERQRARFQLLHSSLTYLDPRLQGYDLAVLMEVLEHIDTPRLPAVEESLFGHARPKTVVVTTPNRAYNAHYEGLADGALRHRDHRFEWSRSEFGAWLERIGQRYGYLSERHEIGEVVASLGAPTQMAVLTRAETTPGKAEQRNVRSQ